MSPTGAAEGDASRVARRATGPGAREAALVGLGALLERRDAGAAAQEIAALYAEAARLGGGRGTAAVRLAMLDLGAGRFAAAGARFRRVFEADRADGEALAMVAACEMCVMSPGGGDDAGKNADGGRAAAGRGGEGGEGGEETSAGASEASLRDRSVLAAPPSGPRALPMWEDIETQTMREQQRSAAARQLQLCRALLRRAEALCPGSALVAGLHGTLLLHAPRPVRDIAAAERLLLRAVQAAPDEAVWLEQYARACYYTGQLDRSFEAAERAKRLQLVEAGMGEAEAARAVAEAKEECRALAARTGSGAEESVADREMDEKMLGGIDKRRLGDADWWTRIGAQAGTVFNLTALQARGLLTLRTPEEVEWANRYELRAAAPVAGPVAPPRTLDQRLLEAERALSPAPAPAAPLALPPAALPRASPLWDASMALVAAAPPSGFLARPGAAGLGAPQGMARAIETVATDPLEVERAVARRRAAQQDLDTAARAGGAPRATPDPRLALSPAQRAHYAAAIQAAAARPCWRLRLRGLHPGVDSQARARSGS
jgi:tetratricopeptide (TPR) repeat protein